MPVDVTLVSAFLIGLLGSTHCVGMCSGIVGAFTLGVRKEADRPRSLLPYLVAYNLGRIGSYAVAGALLGLVGAQVFAWSPAGSAAIAARAIAAAFMLTLGLYFIVGWNALAALERLGGRFWKRVEPLGRALLPVDHPGKALLLGAIWGWLPCGLVYSTLAWSLTSGGAARGALVMAAFGLGTLPMLFAMGAAARWLRNVSAALWMRRGVGSVLVLLGLYVVFALGSGGAHVH